MPESSDANKSPASLINSLRSYRLKGRSNNSPSVQLSFTESSNSLNSCTVLQVSNSPSISSSDTVQEIISPNHLSNTTHLSTPSSSKAQGNWYSQPLGYKKYELSHTLQFVLPCILNKFQSAIKKKKEDLLSFFLSEDEFLVLKEFVENDKKNILLKNWESSVYVKSDHLLTDSKEIEVKREYAIILRKRLSQHLSNLACIKNNSSVDHFPVQSTSEASSVRLVKTYSRAPKVAPSETETLKEETLNNINFKKEDSSKIIMDDYEEFCEKEQNLRKLLNAYPGADIMEAQDILVKCNWDLNEALKIASTQPLRCRKKTSSNAIIGSSIDMFSGKNNEVNNNSQSSASVTVSSSKIAEEITLDSSDDEFNNQVNNKRNFSSGKIPAAKRARKLVSSSESEESSNSSNLVSLSVDSKTSSDIGKTFSMSQYVTIKPVSNTTISNDESKKVNSIPNLPKGLVITQLGSSASKQVSEPGKPIHKNSGSITLTNQKSEVISIINQNNASASHGSKSAQLVRIMVSNNGVDSNHNKHSTSSVVSLPSASSASSVTSKRISPVQKTIKNDYTSREQATSSKSKIIKGKRKKYAPSEDEDDDYGNEDIYDSDDSDIEENLTSAHNAVLRFFQEATVDELSSIPGCSKKKVEAIQNLRPFASWMDLVQKLSNDKTLSTDLLNGGKKVLDMRNAINKLMAKCQQISMDMEDLVESLKENRENSTGYVAKQPDLLNDNMHLAPYQMLGLNWLLLMHNQEVNAILADEMGLGKTVQAISFLAYLKQIGNPGPHLIVVPSSTLDNWRQELQAWWPTVSLLIYHGSQDSRRELRIQILNDEVEEFDVMITTYNMVASNAEDRSFFKRLEFCYVVFDEAHMLKNMSSQRYQHLMRIKAPRRLLLTGTPLQNNLVELMSLLIFAMPHMFSGKTEQVKQMFSCVSKTDGNRNSYEKDRIDHAKRIMKPFVLRRLKKEVLQDLPKKLDELRYCPMIEDQAKKYKALVEKFSAEVQKNREDNSEKISSSGAGMMMQLRRGANHPLLLRHFYDDEKIIKMSKDILQEPTYLESNPDYVYEDMTMMSDFELHRLCKGLKSLKPYILRDEYILASGKFRVLDELLPTLLKEDHRILLFSQFTMVLDIIEEYMNIKEYKFMRLDGQTPVSERQDMIDKFNNDPSISIFLLSTRAGGLGINLTAADTVILHDIDFNPYNDKQAEDRCHRVGQTREVRVIRFISENTIEEGILQSAKEKLKLERDIHDENETEESDSANVAKLLRDALGLKNTNKS